MPDPGRGRWASFISAEPVNERDEDDGAVGNRTARFVLGVIGMWEADEPNADAFRRWVHDGWARVRPFSTGRTYINFQTADEDDERIKETYGPNFERLARDQEDVRPRQPVPRKQEHPSSTLSP